MDKVFAGLPESEQPKTVSDDYREATVKPAQRLADEPLSPGWLKGECELEKVIEALGIPLADDYGALDPGEEVTKFVTALQDRLATSEQQAQEIKRLENEKADLVQRNQILRTRPDSPMTNEDKAAFKRLEQSFAAAQARVGELEELGITQGFWGRACSRLLGKNKQLQATLAAREKRISGLEAELEEYRSLAEQLGAEKAVSERDTARQDVARLNEALELALVELLRIATANVKDCDTSTYAKFKAWAQNRAWHTHAQAQRALKGA